MDLDGCRLHCDFLAKVGSRWRKSRVLERREIEVSLNKPGYMFVNERYPNGTGMLKGEEI